METVLHMESGPAVPGVAEGIREYEKRITDWTFRIESGYERLGGDARRTVRLDESGKMVTTRGLYEWLDSLPTAGVRGVDFLIGGKEGLPSDLSVSPDWTWSLGSLTLNQSIAALVVAEQLYRCWALRNNHPYHNPE